jgi:hypothetical protein
MPLPLTASKRRGQACSPTRSKCVRGMPSATSRCRPRSGRSSLLEKADDAVQILRGLSVVASRGRIEEYRRLAKQCLEMARTISSPDGHATLVQMAQTWLRLAREQETAAQQQQPGPAPRTTTRRSRPPHMWMAPNLQDGRLSPLQVSDPRCVRQPRRARHDPVERLEFPAASVGAVRRLGDPHPLASRCTPQAT